MAAKRNKQGHVVIFAEEGPVPVTVEMAQAAVKEYDEHENDPYAYHQEEIEAVGNLRRNAREFIGFLLEQLDKAAVEQKNGGHTESPRPL